MEGIAKPVIGGPRAGVVGAAIVPHAPQILSLPDSEDKAQVARVRAAMRVVGDGLRDLAPDLTIVIANCHGEEMVVHCVPPFMLHRGDRAEGAASHKGSWRVDGDSASELLERLLEEGFDPAFTFDTELGTAFTIPWEFCGYGRATGFVPIFVNAYVPPQPSPERCFAFGKALNRALERMGKRAVIIASGGLSHYPGTPMYPTPDIETDRIIFAKLAAGNLLHLMSFDANQLDRSGNVECRSLQILAGAIGDRKPDSAVFEPSWHHIYAVVGWTRSFEPDPYQVLYPGFAARHSELARAIHRIVIEEEACAAYRADRAAFARRFDLDHAAAKALVALDEDELRETYAVNPMLTYQAKIKVGDPLKHRTRIT